MKYWLVCYRWRRSNRISGEWGFANAPVRGGVGEWWVSVIEDIREINSKKLQEGRGAFEERAFVSATPISKKEYEALEKLLREE